MRKKKYSVLLTVIGLSMFGMACGNSNNQKQDLIYSNSPNAAVLSNKSGDSQGMTGKEDKKAEPEAMGTITDIFLNPHDEPELEKEADLNGDGALEKITLTQLPYNGGDGGCLLKVFKAQSARELPLPDSYDKETGFPFCVKWDGEQIQIFAGQECIAELNAGQVQEIYQNKDMTDVLEMGKGRPEEIKGDAVSGFTVIQEDNQSNAVLMVKSYLSGLGGHSDCLGYGITRLQLDGDDTWNVEYSFMLDEDE